MKTVSLFNPFNYALSFSPIDPLDDGLREEIIAEQQESGAISLSDDTSDIGQFWRDVELDTAHNGGQLEFSE